MELVRPYKQWGGKSQANHTGQHPSWKGREDLWQARHQEMRAASHWSAAYVPQSEEQVLALRDEECPTRLSEWTGRERGDYSFPASSHGFHPSAAGLVGAAVV